MTIPPHRRAPSNLGTYLALAGLLLAGGGLLGLSTMALLPGAGFLFVIFCFFSVGALHYLLWGWWLGKPKIPKEFPPQSRAGDDVDS